MTDKIELKRKILELFCGDERGNIDCTSEAEFELDNILSQAPTVEEKCEHKNRKNYDDNSWRCPDCKSTGSATPVEEKGECQWENCSGGRYCPKHSLETKSEDSLSSQKYGNYDLPSENETTVRIGGTQLTPPVQSDWEDETKHYRLELAHQCKVNNLGFCIGCGMTPEGFDLLLSKVRAETLEEVKKCVPDELIMSKNDTYEDQMRIRIFNSCREQTLSAINKLN